MTCTVESHEATKRDREAWSALTYHATATYDLGDGETLTLETRHCRCGSTLAVEVNRGEEAPHTAA